MGMEIKPGYKDITNYLRNELGIDREYITEVVEKSIANTVKQVIEAKLTDVYLESSVGKAVKTTITDKSTSYSRASMADKFDEAVLSSVKKSVGKILAENFNIEFKVTSTVSGTEQ